jgi:hypothetical protein
MDEAIKQNTFGDVVNQVTGSSPLNTTQSMMFNTPGGAQVTNNRSMLTSIYVSHGVIQALINQPVDDAFRGGINISSAQLQPEDRKRLQRRLRRDRVWQKLAQAWKWGRLFGGAGLIINSGQDNLQPFRIEKIKKGQALELYPVDRWELAYMPQGQLNNQFEEHLTEVPYNYYGVTLHKSHVIRVQGMEAPALIRGQFMGWGMSEVERVVASYNTFLKNRNVTYEILDEAKLDVFKIRGLNAASMTKDGQTQLAAHLQATAQLKSYQNAMAIDSEDDFTQKQLSFSGLAEIAGQNRIDMASDCRFPMTKLFGLSPSGFDTGDADIENYNSMVETEIRSKCEDDVHHLVEMYCMLEFGFIPEDLECSFQPLRETKPIDQSGLKTQELNRIIAGFQNGFFTERTAVEQINAEGIFTQALDVDEALSMESLIELRGGGSDEGPIVPGGNTDASVVLR